LRPAPIVTLFPYTTLFRSDDGAEGGMVGLQAGAEMAHEVLDLVDRDGIAHAGVDAAALLQGDAAVDADQFAVHVEKGTAAVAWRSEEHTSELQSRGHLVCR